MHMNTTCTHAHMHTCTVHKRCRTLSNAEALHMSRRMESEGQQQAENKKMIELSKEDYQGCNESTEQKPMKKKAEIGSC